MVTTTRASARSVKVKILTHSPAANDNGLSHAGYKKYRKALLTAGAELFELRPDAQLRDQFKLTGLQVNTINLHSKAAVFDRKVGLVGSYNLDPRSRNINTEIGVLIHDAVFAGQLADVIIRGMLPENSWRLKLEAMCNRVCLSRCTWLCSAAS